ncbi:MAG: serine/threonine-protein kinase [Planctomycetota bacterium]|nr:serine/threonine-protein kinase [Planctomycetota bacterium]
MGSASAHPQADQEFLAALVHRGWLGREQARTVLEAATLAEGLQAAVGWDSKQQSWLRRTRGMQTPEIPGYRIGERLGAGGTAEVWAAQREKDFARVALKIQLPALARDPIATQRFVEESKVLQSLELPGVVRCFRAFRFLGLCILELERVAGRTLEEELADGRAYAEREALAIVLQVARTLEGLRQAGVVHRDLKPGNLMITADGKVKLIDLGFAGRGADVKAAAGTTLGTPAYLAPEQARGDSDLDARADIYSLGATLYHLVFGRLPFEASNDEEMLRKQVLAGLDGSALKGGRVSPALHYFLEKMMAKDREVRYPTPAALALDLEAHLAR